LTHLSRCWRVKASSGLLVALLAADSIAAGPKTAAQVELELASRGGIYLVVGAGPELQVKARGVVLDRLPLIDFGLMVYQPTFGAAAESPVHLPASWAIIEDAAATLRPRLTPAALEEYASAAASGSGAAAQEILFPEPPDRYRVELEGGWQLVVGRELPDRGLLRRFWYSVVSGFRRVRGVALEEKPQVVMALGDDEARKLHHLLRPGTTLLVLPQTPPLP
jgi:hypothetical protein